MTSTKVEVEKTFQFNEAKFIELILYIADKSSDDPDFGAIKLNKILFYSDFFAYGKLKKPITGATYFKLTLGPAPKQLVPIREQMIKRGEITVQSEKRYNYQQQRVIPKRKACLDYFSTKEIAIINKVIKMFWEVNAKMSSLVSHMEFGWQVAYEKEDIPYETVFLSNDPLDDYESRHGLELAKKYGWAIQGS